METENGLDNARRKLVEKNLDFIVLNSIREPGAGFGAGTNRVTIVDAAKEEAFDVKPKSLVAADILHELSLRLPASK